MGEDRSTMYQQQQGYQQQQPMMTQQRPMAVTMVVIWPQGISWRASPNFNNKVTNMQGPLQNTVMSGPVVQGQDGLQYMQVGSNFLPLSTPQGQQLMQQQMQQQNMGMQQQNMMNNDIRRVQQGYAQQPMGYGNQGMGHGGHHGGKMKKMKKGCHGGKKHKGYKIKLF